jgi:N6-L-threonylcarbamoyladenine synthase/protein kinase Bud32
MRILGIEGTAWAASAAVFEAGEVLSGAKNLDTASGGTASSEGGRSELSLGASSDDHVFIETDAYQPESGGIHPREAAEHMGEAIPEVVETALDHARERADDPERPIDAVAFSRGPGLGPCLRIVGTAARAVAQRFDVPLVGVNHMVAHLEVGRYYSGFDAPVCLNASGANAHVLGYRSGRYRVLGETMDTGVGNAIDKFTRHIGWSHPGGPKVESHAKDGEYVDLPYVVKGMDFSFSGIMSAAKQAADDGTPVEDVCRGLEETIFAMLAEVAERALSLTDADELVLGGGVGQNERLRSMLAEMCEQRGADFYAPEPRFLRDNAGMIAILGARMYAAGDTIPIEESRIDADFRPDQVDVTWDAGEPVARTGAVGDEVQGAEAVVTIEADRVIKERRPRSYRHPQLDARLRTERTRQEARLTSEARRNGVPTPVVSDVDLRESRIVFQRVGDRELRDGLTESRVRAVGRHLAAIHDAGFVHGDPTTRNVRVGDGDGPDVFLIDFGLGYYTRDTEDHAMDLHVFAQSLMGTTDDAERLQAAMADAYRTASDRDGAVLERLATVEGRGRYQ